MEYGQRLSKAFALHDNENKRKEAYARKSNTSKVVHLLVAKMYLDCGSYVNGHEYEHVIHIDGNKRNNTFTNLKALPVFGRYKLSINYRKYINYISALKATTNIYVFSYITKVSYRLVTWSQIPLLFGLPFNGVDKAFTKDGTKPYYRGGYMFSRHKFIPDLKFKKVREALEDRDKIWRRLSKCK